eukprot:Gb_38374 [translate_table: standard]
MAERMAYNGISVISVDFLSRTMHRSFASAINIVNNFMGISQISAVVGGFLADAYLGRYWTIAIFSIVYLLGLTLLTLSATVKRLIPSQVGCDVVALQTGKCQPTESWQMSYLIAALYITATGAAGIRPCVSAFGADQFDEREPNYKTHLDRFFNFFYLFVTIGSILSLTLVVYLHTKLGWGYAFGSLAVAMGLSNVIFLAVTCIPVFCTIFIFVMLSLYDVLFVPFIRRFTGHPRGMTILQRIGTGLAISVLSVLWAGIFEQRRRKYAVDNGFEEKFFVSMPGMSAYWLAIQFCLIGLAELFAGVGSIEFFFEEAPDAMRSLGTSFATTAGGLGCFLSTFIHTVVKSVTAKNGHTSWLDQNINKGHYDYYYWFCALLSAVNFLFFLLCAHLYKYKAMPDSHDTSLARLEAQKDVESL